VETIDLGGGRRATYEVVGDGLPAIMLPGGPGFASAYMRGDAELFRGSLRSHLIDPHGSGGSTPPADPGDYSSEGHARFYEEVRRALGLGPVVVFGHSFGATTALTYSAMYPDAIRACVAVAAFGLGPDTEDEAVAEEAEAMLERHAGADWFPGAKEVWDAWTERVLATDDPAEVEAMMAAVLPLYTAHPERPDVAAGLERFGRYMKVDLAACKAWEGGLFQGTDLRPFLGRIQAPTLVVAGELDLVCGPAQALPIADGIPDATLALVPDCGHIPAIEAPDRYRADVSGWLATHGS
jgi:proline iminopeptidase